MLPDGTPFDCPARDPLPPPLDVPATLRDSLVVLALPVRRPGVDEADLGVAGADSLARYVAELGREPLVRRHDAITLETIASVSLSSG